MLVVPPQTCQCAGGLQTQNVSDTGVQCVPIPQSSHDNSLVTVTLPVLFGVGCLSVAAAVGFLWWRSGNSRMLAGKRKGPPGRAAILTTLSENPPVRVFCMLWHMPGGNEVF